MAYLIAESGSTKTDWCCVSEGGGEKQFFQTQGVNPYLQGGEAIVNMLCREAPEAYLNNTIDAVYFYGAGLTATAKQTEMRQLLQGIWQAATIHVAGDMLSAARALCRGEKGMVAILGTGSASCYFDGTAIKQAVPSLGYMAGDEGSGNHLGKRVLQYYAYKTFDTELKMDFEMRFGNSLEKIINKLYHEPYPNRLLASFSMLLAHNRGHYMVENILEDCINDFFQYNILKYRQSWKYNLHFTGSIAYEYRDVLANLCHQYELELGTILKSPLEGLIAYHAQERQQYT